jgi:hypothetical protein
MRAFWSIFLITGLLLTVLSVYQRRTGTVDRGSAVISEDGTGYPSPAPTPKIQ